MESGAIHSLRAHLHAVSLAEQRGVQHDRRPSPPAVGLRVLQQPVGGGVQRHNELGVAEPQALERVPDGLHDLCGAQTTMLMGAWEP
ncbi:MAG: hypothetical protein WDW38_009736 [Sanguina aurantia]